MINKWELVVGRCVRGTCVEDEIKENSSGLAEERVKALSMALRRRLMRFEASDG